MRFAAIAVILALLPGGTFVDDTGSVHEANIEAIAAAGITKGCNPPANDHFCPDQAVTRGEMAAFLDRALTLPGGADAFSDDDDSVFASNIDAVAAAGIVRGCNPPDNTRYCPNRSITRAEMATMLTRAFSYPGSTTDWFTDDNGSIHESAINAIAEAGVTLGCNPPSNDHYCPGAPVTRAQMASFLVRALGLTPLPPDPLPADYVTPDDVGVTIGVGVIAPVPTVHVGDQTLDTDGALLENVIVDGCVTITGNNVTIRNVVVNCGGYYPIKANEPGVQSGLNIHHSRIRSTFDTKLFVLNDITAVTISHNELVGGDDTVFADGNLDGFTFTRNYRHDPLGDSTTHLDGFQLGEFEVTTGDFEISYNYFDEIPNGIGVTDLVFATNFSAMHIDIIGNYISEHGWYTLRAYNTATFTVEENTVASSVHWAALLNSPGPHYFACNFFTSGEPITAANITGGDQPGVTYGSCE